MPPAVKSEIVFPFPTRYRTLSRGRRLLVEFSAGLVILALIGVGASLQMPSWVRLIGWTFLVGYWAMWAGLVMRRWLQRRGWER